MRNIIYNSMAVLMITLSSIALYSGVMVSATSGTTVSDYRSNIPVTICHTNAENGLGSASNPYQVITTDVSGVIQDGHGDHEGYLASSYEYASYLKNTLHVGWGDIIPAFDYGDGYEFEGLNYYENELGADYYGLGKAMLENGCQYLKIVATVKEPTFVDPTCDNDKTAEYIIPSHNGVVYKVNGKKVSAGTYSANFGETIKITAEADAGSFIKTSVQTEWTHTFDDEPTCPVISEAFPVEPGYIKPTCDLPGAYVIPYVQGVTYYADGKKVASGKHDVDGNKTITFTVKANEGYFIDSETTTSWFYTYTVPTEEECTLGVQSVIPAEVTFTASTCSALGYYTIPLATGVQYYIDNKIVTTGNYTVANGTTIVVTAKAAGDGYELKPGVTVEWSNTFNAPTNCDNGGSATELPHTGVGSTVLIAGFIFTATALLTKSGMFIRKLLVRQ